MISLKNHVKNLFTNFHLKETIDFILTKPYTLPKLELYLLNLKRYVDDTFAYVLPDGIDMTLYELNLYHQNIKFTY